MEKISVIIPAYNAEKYLVEAAASIQNQNWKGEMEIIIIDDGSTDNTLTIAKKIGGIVLTKEKGGAASARNMGIRNASGELLFFFDADDIAATGALEQLYEPMLRDKKFFAVFGKAQDFLSPELSAEQISLLQIRKEPYGGVLPGCALIRREAFEKIGLFDESLKTGETVAWQINLREAKLPTVNIDCVTLNRRLHLTNTGRVNNRQEMQDYAAILRRRMKKE
ncbi:MAG: glycosyltransferase family 2 protein [Clostridium sp.]|nr:glycosyltransferase family 2 protein [Clostridium sp.]